MLWDGCLLLAMLLPGAQHGAGWGSCSAGIPAVWLRVSPHQLWRTGATARSRPPVRALTRGEERRDTVGSFFFSI